MPNPSFNPSTLVDFNASEIGESTGLGNLPNFSAYADDVQFGWKALDNTRPTVSPDENYCSVGVMVMLKSGPMLIVGTAACSEIQSANFQEQVLQEMIRAFPGIALDWKIPSDSAQQFVADELYKLHKAWQGKIEDFVLLFARWSWSVLGAGNYVFVNSSTSASGFPKTFNDIELTAFWTRCLLAG